MGSFVIAEKIFNGRENVIVLTIEEPKGTPKPWTGIDHMVIDLIDKAGVITTIQKSTATVPSVINFTVDGVLTITLGDQSLSPGTYKIELAVVDTSGGVTQIIQWDRDKVEFTVHATETVT